MKISVGTVRNNMNWYKGINITNKGGGENLVIYLKEKAVPFRSEQRNSQLKKDKYPLVELKDKSLYDLIPG